MQHPLQLHNHIHQPVVTEDTVGLLSWLTWPGQRKGHTGHIQPSPPFPYLWRKECVHFCGKWPAPLGWWLLGSDLVVFWCKFCILKCLNSSIACFGVQSNPFWQRQPHRRVRLQTLPWFTTCISSIDLDFHSSDKLFRAFLLMQPIIWVISS